MNALFLAFERASLFGLAALLVALVAQWVLDGRVPASWRVWLWRVALLQTALSLVLALVPLTPLRLAILAPQFQKKAPLLDKGIVLLPSDLAPLPAVVSPAPLSSAPLRAPSDPALSRLASAAVPLGAAPLGERAPHQGQLPKLLPANQPAPLFPVRTTLALIYAFGLTIQLGLLVRSFRRVQRLLRPCVPVGNAETSAHVKRIAQKMGVSMPLILQSEGAAPFLVGILRPAIVLTCALLESQKGDLEAVLSHELAHLKRRDLAWNALLWLVQSLLWFHPLVWISRRFLALETESACDEMVLNSTRISPKSYGALLLNTMKTEPTPLIVGIADGFFALKTRLVRLNQAPKRPRRASQVAFATTLCLGFGALIPLRLVAQAQIEAPSPPAAKILGGKQEVLCVAFSPDGKLLAEGGAQGEIRIYDVRKRDLQHTLRGQSRQIFSLAWSPDGSTLANSYGELWDTTTWRVREKLAFAVSKPKLPYTLFNVAVAWSPDGQSLVSGGSYRTLFRRAAGPSGARPWKVVRREPSDWIYSVAFSPDGHLLAEGGMNHFRLWDARQLRPQVGWKPSPALMGSNHSLLALLNRYISLSANGKTPRDVLLKQRFAIERYLWATGGAATEIAFSPDGKTLAVARSESGTDVHRAGISAPGGRKITFRSSATQGGKIALWDLRTGALQHLLSVSGASLSALAFSPDGRTIAAAGSERGSRGRGKQEHEIELWDVHTGEPLQALKGHSSQINSLAWSPDGVTLASGSRDKTVRLWPIIVPVSEPNQKQVGLLQPSNRTPQGTITLFYNAINQQNFNAAANLLWDRPIGGVDLSGLRQALSEAKANGLVLRIEEIRIERFGDEAAARFKVLVSNPVPQTKFNRLVLGEVRAELRRGERGWQLLEEPLPASVGRAEIIGRVVDEAGHPLAGVGVTANLMDFAQRLKLPSRADVRALQVSSTLKRRLMARLSGTLDVTRVDGTFRLSGLTGGTYAVGVDRSVNVSGSTSNLGAPAGYFLPRSLRVNALEGTRTVAPNVALQRGVTVQGRIVDATTLVPLRGVEISAFTKQETSRPDRRGSVSRMEQLSATDQKGRYTMTLPPGAIGLTIWGRRANQGQNTVVQVSGVTYSVGRDVKAVVNGVKRSFDNMLWLPQVSKGQNFNVELQLQRVQASRK